MIRKSKFWYCTLFWPKYCAASGAAPNSASATATPPMRRMNLILSTGPPGPSRPESRHRAPVRRSRGAPAGRTRAIRDERRVRRSPRSPAAPSGPGPALRRDGERCRGAPTPSSSAPPSRARARPKCPIRSQSSRPRRSGLSSPAPADRSPSGPPTSPSRAAGPEGDRSAGAGLERPDRRGRLLCDRIGHFGRARARDGGALDDGVGAPRHRSPSRRRAGPGPLGAAGLRGLRRTRLSSRIARVLPAGAPLERRTGARCRDSGRLGPGGPVERMRFMRRIGGVAVALALFGAAPLAAQYFGQNKVQYQNFDFRIIQTEHFEVYYYPAERAGALDAARMAERWYARLSRILHHQFQARKPIILYASQSDFQQTNTTSEDLGEGTGGFTEFFKHRMVLPFTGTYAELEHVLGHEMVHQFQYDVISRGHIGAGVQTLVNANLPGWFMEGMAEYLSIGPIDPHTSMWLRDASLEGHLPTIEEMTFDPRIFPYRFGHALLAYVGEKWGDEAIGQILQASIASGVEGGFKRSLGITLDDLSSEWRDAVQTTYLPQLADHYRARRIAQPLLTQKRSEGTLHLAPALSPDGREIAYFSEKNSFFVDLYLADAETGRVKRRLVKSTLNSNYESLRFINSAGSFSPDGRYFAIAAKRKDRDDLVILDVKKDKEVRRIRIPLNGLTTPSWSPDGKQLVFTGYDGGLSDLFVVNADGSNLHRLTNDKYADLEPSWSPDGKTIAFTTDRSPATDFETLKFGRLRIALLRLDNGSIDILRHMDQGKNINPTWAPDGRSLAFVSDRNGISNIFLYELSDGNIYQLTDVFTGVSGITALSPCLSWAHEADRLAFAYYEDGEYNVYAVDNPRSLKRQPYQAPATPLVTSLLAAERRALAGPTAVLAGAAPE